MIKNRSGDLRRLAGIGNLNVCGGICGGDAHECINGRSVGGPTEDVGRNAGSACVCRQKCAQKQNTAQQFYRSGAKSLSENGRNSVAADVRRRISHANRRFVRLLKSAATIFWIRAKYEFHGGLKLHWR